MGEVKEKMPARYTPLHVAICSGQEKKIQHALQHRRKRITIHFSKLPEESSQKVSDGNNTGILCLTAPQLKKVHHASVGTAFAFSFSTAQIKHNIHYKGGFLSILAAILAPIIGGIIGGVTEQAIAGSGLAQDVVYHNRSHSVKVISQGKGFYLSPFRNFPISRGRGLYLAPPAYGRGFQKIRHAKQLPTKHPLKKAKFLNIFL